MPQKTEKKHRSYKNDALLLLRYIRKKCFVLEARPDCETPPGPWRGPQARANPAQCDGHMAIVVVV